MSDGGGDTKNKNKKTHQRPTFHAGPSSALPVVAVEGGARRKKEEERGARAWGELEVGGVKGERDGRERRKRQR